MAKRIITISREFGSGGRFIGEEVAKKLGIAYYDKNVINEIAEKSGLSPEYIQENAELSPKKGCLHMHLLDVTSQEDLWRIWYMRRREKLF
ncbi:MAG: AAA family ATPase [Ruminococcus sp.]